jgi:hypothetical protein
MSQEGGRLRSKLVIWSLLFVLGFVSGFVVRDRQHHGQVEETFAKGRADVQARLGRSLRAGEKLQEGAKAAVEELMGTSQEGDGER